MENQIISDLWKWIIVDEMTFVCTGYHDIQQEVMSEEHNSNFSVHPRIIKMYQDLKNNYWWNEIKKDVVKFVFRCQIRQKFKTKQ